MPSGSRVPARFVAFAVGGVVVLCIAALFVGCSTPRTASGTLDEGKQRVTQLVLDTAHSLPATVKFQPPTETGSEPCRRTVAGYVVGKTGANRAQVPLIVYTPDGVKAQNLLTTIETAWTDAGYRVDRSRIKEDRFPQIRATTPDGDSVVATAFSTPKAVASQIDLYAVSQCLRGK